MAKESGWKHVSGKKRAGSLAMELARVNGGLNQSARREKYTRMADSAFSFYRGTAHLFYRDLSYEKLLESSPFASADAVTWIQGDLHLNNFGAFCDGEGDVVFDLNDFDEAWITSYLYDVWRGAVSLVLTGEDNGLSGKQVKECVDEFTLQYLHQIKRYHDVDRGHYDKVTAATADGPLKKFLTKAETRKSRKDMLDSWTVMDGERRKFNRDKAKLAHVSTGDDRLLRAAISVYKDNLSSDLRGDEAYFEVRDTAMRLGAGVGSFGTPRYYVLIRGLSDDPDARRILDLKEQGMPSMYPFLNAVDQARLLSAYPENKAGLRVISGQRAMLRDPDKHLGFFTILGRSFSVRERSPFKKCFNVAKLKEMKDFKDMAHHWGTILAGGHSRGDDAVKQGGIDSFEREVMRLTRHQPAAFQEECRHFALNYARQVRTDYTLFLEMIGAR